MIHILIISYLVVLSTSFLHHKSIYFRSSIRNSKLQLVRLQIDALNDYIQQVMHTSTNGIIIVDGDNVRGKTKFSLSKEALCLKVEQWRSMTNLTASIILLFDHGSEHVAFYKPDSGISVVFSGPVLKADDVIARDILYCQNALNSSVVAIVTEDVELKKRCRKNSVASASSKRKLSKESKKKEPAMEELSFDMKDRKVMTIDSTKFADMLIQCSRHSLQFDTSNRVLTQSPVPSVSTTDPSILAEDVIDASVDIENKATKNDQSSSSSNSGLEGTNSVELREYRRRLETLIQQESKLRYELQKLQSLVDKQIKPSRGDSKRKTVHKSVHERIQDIQLKTDNIVLSTQAYIRSFSSNMTTPTISSSSIVNSSSDSSTTSTTATATNPIQALSIDTPQANTDILKEYNISQDFYERGSDLILNYFSKYRQRQLSRGSHKQGYMEETWERVILAERMRRQMLISTDSIMLYKSNATTINTSSITDIVDKNTSISYVVDNPIVKYVKHINSRLYVND